MHIFIGCVTSFPVDIDWADNLYRDQSLILLPFSLATASSMNDWRDVEMCFIMSFPVFPRLVTANIEQICDGRRCHKVSC